MSNKTTDQLGLDAMERLEKLHEDYGSTPLLACCVTIMQTLGAFFSRALSEEEGRQRRPGAREEQPGTDGDLS
jgi:hypothetical protein